MKDFPFSRDRESLQLYQEIYELLVASKLLTKQVKQRKQGEV